MQCSRKKLRVRPMLPSTFDSEDSDDDNDGDGDGVCAAA